MNKKKTESLLRATFEATGEGILAVDLYGKTVAFNRRFVEMWRLSLGLVEEGHGRSLVDAMSVQLAETGDFVTKMHSQYLQPELESYDVLDLADGRTFECHASPQWIGREIVGRVWSYRDITVQKRAKQENERLAFQLCHAQRLEAIGRLSGSIAHELNNILTPILLASELMGSSDSAGEFEANLKTIQTCAQQGCEIVRQILSFARGVAANRGPVSVFQVIHDMGLIVKTTFPKEIVVALTVPTNLWPILADPTQVHQVILNLCLNARDAMPNGGRLSISACNVILRGDEPVLDLEGKSEPYICLSVEDTGSGIDPLFLDRIFDPFFSTKPAGKGSGLGLSTTLGIVKSHGGFAKVASQPERGTRFDIFFPAVPGEMPFPCYRVECG